MPTRNSQATIKTRSRVHVKKKQNLSPINRLNITKIKIIALFIPAVILIGSGLLWYQNSQVTSRYQNEIEAYLHTKYGDDFIVDSMRKDSTGLGTDNYTAIAYSKHDPNLKFVVNYTVAPIVSIGDQYLWAVWRRDDTSRVESEISTISAKPQSLDTRLSINPTRKIEELRPGKILSYDDALHQGDKTINLAIDLSEPTNVTTSQVQEDAAYITQIAKHFTSNRAYILSISYNAKLDDGRKISCSDAYISYEKSVDHLLNCITSSSN